MTVQLVEQNVLRTSFHEIDGVLSLCFFDGIFGTKNSHDFKLQ